MLTRILLVTRAAKIRCMGWIRHKYRRPGKAELQGVERIVQFYADHNVDYSIVEALRIKKYDVETARDIGAEKQHDEFHFRRAFRSKRVLLTLDRDFLDNRRFPLSQTHGIIVLNVDTSSIPKLARAVEVVYVILGGLAGLLKEKKVIVNSDRTITLIGRAVDQEGSFEYRTRYKFDDNGRDIWEWEDDD